MTGYIGFENDKLSIIGKIIKFFTKSKWCHCFIMLSKDLVFESNSIKNEITPFENKLKRIRKNKLELEFYKINNITESYINMITFINDNFGKTYGYLQLIGFIPVIVIKKIFKVRIKNPFKSGDVCSELVLKWLLLFNHEDFNKLDLNTTSPQDLYEIINKSSNFTKILEF